MRRNIVLGLAVAAVVLCTVVITQLFGGDARHGPLQQLERARPERSFAPRLSIPNRYHSCTSVPADSQAPVPREECGESDGESLDLDDLAAGGKSAHPDSLQASALVDVLWKNKRQPEVLNAAILRLEKALRLSADSVPLLVDLSAAHLLRAERTQTPYDVIVAINYAEKAVVREPGNVAAQFNAALALQAWGLDDEASRAWDAYLAIDSTSEWAEEARWRKAKLIRLGGIQRPAVGASPEEVAKFAADYPQEAREFGWNRVLGDWGKAVEEGDAARAALHLNLAAALGRGLQLRPGGDASLADAVRDIRVARGEATMALAREYSAYATGQRHFQKDDEASYEAFTRVVLARPPSPVLLQWAALFQARTLGYLKGDDEAYASVLPLLAQVDSTRHPALAGRARMLHGMLLLRRGELGKAREQLGIAAEHFHQAGEAELAHAARSADGESACGRGETHVAYQLLHQVQRALRPYGRSISMHNQLHGLQLCVIEDGMPYAALRILNEDVAVAQRVGQPVAMVDALQARVVARTIVGDFTGAERDLDSAIAIAGALGSDVQKEWARSVLHVAAFRSGSAAATDPAMEHFTGDNVLWMFPALMRRADARLAAGDVTGATDDLEAVVTHVEALARQQSKATLRSAVLEQARSRFDKLVMLYLRAGKTGDALRTLERGRVSFAPVRAPGTPAGNVHLAAPPGHVALEYALIGDTLLAWTIRGDTSSLVIQPVNRNTFLLTVEETVAALESGGREADVQPELRQLYNWLILPVRDRLGPPETPLVILADGEVAGVPFPALLDERGRPLLKDHPLRIAPTLADAARPAVQGRSGPALLVANPAFDLSRYPTLNPLQGARTEVDSLMKLYPHTVLLEEGGATRDALVAGAQRASVIHYAGHAVFDDARPERSYLLLAGADTTDRLTAEAVGTMQLRGVRLVVLSACRTLRSNEGRSGGFAGLSGALLMAGAGGVVGSQWQVNDGLTQQLMAAFHSEYLKSGDPARALRKAQLEMLNSSDPRQRSPAAWAGFRYTGAERS